MGLEILQAIQRISHPVLDALFIFFTLFGEKMVLAGIFCAIYWCFDKQLGRYLMLSLCGSLCVNGAIKDTFAFSRPIGEAGIVSKFADSATGHSFPSGHAQSSATFWWGIALWLKKRWIKVLALLLVLAVSFSRLYLGVHYPRDVIVGAALGIAASSLFFWLLKRKSHTFLYGLCAVLAAICLIVGDSKDSMSAVAMTVGVFAGMLFEDKLVGFPPVPGLLRKGIRLALGGVILGVIYLLPKLLLPGSDTAGAIAIGVVAFCAMGPYPWLVKKLRL